MLKIFAVSSLVAVANGFDINCDASKCPDTCTCSKNNCAAPIDACLADGDCSKAQECAMQCACGDEACLLDCVGKTSSPLAMPAAECIQTNCPARNMLMAELEDVDCGSAKCPEACECSKDKCGDAINTCLADSECSKVQDCAMDCGCGDDACMLACAQSSSSPLAEPVATCVASNCHVAASMLKSAAAIDCADATCKEACECSMDKCGDAINSCLADSECSKVQDCAMGCSCGDDDCMLGCAQSSTSPLAQPVATCVASECHVAARLLKSAATIDCAESACPKGCACSMDKCGDAVNSCLADPECSKVQDCAMGCGCGDDDCMVSCAQSSSSPLAEPVATCVASNCHSAMLQSAAPNLSCHGAACEDACHCGKTKCLGVGMACLFDPKCSAFQDCSFKCPCGDKECAISCANELSAATSKAMPLAECITTKCHTDLHV